MKADNARLDEFLAVRPAQRERSAQTGSAVIRQAAVLDRQGQAGIIKRAGRSGPFASGSSGYAGRCMLNFARIAMSVAASNRAAARSDRIFSFLAIAFSIRSGLSRSAHSLGEVRSPRSG